MDVRRFLRRLAAVAPPGAAGRAGVPADRRAMVERELVPVFAALAPVEAGAAAERAKAQSSAERLLSEAMRRAEAELAEARAEAVTLRRQTLEERAAAGRAELAMLLADARREADRIDRRRREVAPGLTEKALGRLLEAFVPR